MRQLPDTVAGQKHAIAITNTNTTTVTLNAIADEYHVIDQIVYSIDHFVTNPNNDVHLVIKDETADEILMNAGILNAGLAFVPFVPSGLVVPKNHTVTVSLFDTLIGAGETNHVVVFYR